MDSEKDKDYRSTTNIIFTGSKVEEWFKFDRQVLRWVRKNYSDAGVKLWCETATLLQRGTGLRMRIGSGNGTISGRKGIRAFGGRRLLGRFEIM